MVNPENNVPQSPDLITSLGVNSEGEVVIVTQGTDGSYSEESFNDTSLPLGRIQKIFLEQQRVLELLSDSEPAPDEIENDGSITLDLDEIRRQIEIAQNSINENDS